MPLRPPQNPTVFDRAWLFLQNGLGCIAALVCLVGGFVCAAGIGRNDWRFITLGALLMLPYAIPAALFLLQFLWALLTFVPWMLWEFDIKPLLRKLKPK